MVSPMRFLAWSEAHDRATAMRPIHETVLLAVVPPLMYMLGLAVLWIGRGFRPEVNA